MTMRTYQLLRIDASANPSASTSRKLGDYYVSQTKAEIAGVSIIERDLNHALPQLSESWLHAYFTDEAERSQPQQDLLTQSNQLIDELVQADEILITTPMYNFSVPSSLKAWIDLVCRAGVTFEYTETGPRGLIASKPVKIIVSTGGVPVQSSMDFLTDYLKQVLAFIGLTDVTVIAADKMNVNAKASYDAAKLLIDYEFEQLAQTA